MRIMRIMNAIQYIRTKVFDLNQAAFAAEIAEVSQPTVSRWEDEKQPGSQPDSEDMKRIRDKAIKRGLPWNDSWFFQTFPDEENAA